MSADDWWHQAAGRDTPPTEMPEHVTTWQAEHAEPWERSIVRDRYGRLWTRTNRAIEPWRNHGREGAANWIALLNYHAPLTLVHDGYPGHWSQSQWHPEQPRILTPPTAEGSIT
ncbi:hypothetical protein [Rhodococcoides fascians]|uniref:hypothetical protein n=1 Tax=Rhodococcoides fascians TaxID=1828 RepID=UPI00050CE3C1|nr:hypothetical protein [Rhodococcus fascians]